MERQDAKQDAVGHLVQVDSNAVSLASGVDAHSGMPYAQGELSVSRAQVAAYTGLDAYHCTCYAIGKQAANVVRSDRALVTIACTLLRRAPIFCDA